MNWFTALFAFLCLSVCSADACAQRYRPLHDELSQRQRALELELGRADALQRKLVREDRAARPIYPGLIVMGVGFGGAALSSVVLLLAGLNPGADPREVRAFTIAHLIGVPVGLGGLAYATYQLVHRPHREQIRELHRERHELKRELKLLRREQRLSYAPGLTLGRGGASLSLTLRF